MHTASRKAPRGVCHLDEVPAVGLEGHQVAQVKRGEVQACSYGHQLLRPGSAIITTLYGERRNERRKNERNERKRTDKGGLKSVSAKCVWVHICEHVCVCVPVSVSLCVWLLTIKLPARTSPRPLNIFVRLEHTMSARTPEGSGLYVRMMRCDKNNNSTHN